jgi:hypothetical protein
LVAGLAGGGAVVLGGAIAGIVAGVQAANHKKEEERRSTTFLSTPAPLVKTVLTTPLHVGDSVIEVADQSGFAIGDVIQIGNEINEVKGFSSIILNHPVSEDHPAGVAVELLTNATGGQASTTPDVDAVLGGGVGLSTSIRAREEANTGNGSSGAAMVVIGLLVCAAAICAASLTMFFCSSRKGRSSRSREDDEDYDEVDSEDEESEEEEEEDAPAQLADPAHDPLAMTEYAVVKPASQNPGASGVSASPPGLGNSFFVPPSMNPGMYKDLYK